MDIKLLFGIGKKVNFSELQANDQHIKDVAADGMNSISVKSFITHQVSHGVYAVAVNSEGQSDPSNTVDVREVMQRRVYPIASRDPQRGMCNTIWLCELVFVVFIVSIVVVNRLSDV